MRNIRKINKILIIVLLFTLFISTIKKDICYASEMESDSVLLGEEQESVQETIAVSDIELGDYEEELEIGKTLTLSVTVLPSNATNSSLTYTSSDTLVATVNSSGEIKGVAKGTVTITIQAGNVVKTITIKVKVASKVFNVNTNYLVLKPNEEFLLSANVSPSDANQSITYKSIDTSVAKVSDSGNVRGIAEGSTTIVLSNGDITTAVTVIINKVTNAKDVITTNQSIIDPVSTLSENEQKLINLIQESELIEIQASECEILTKNILKKLQEANAKLIIHADNYTITIEGKDIINYENELLTNISFTKDNRGYTFIVNEGNNLPGKIYLKMNNEIEGKYLYLYNNAKEQYQLLNNNGSEITLDQAGKYYITDEKIAKFNVNIIIIILISVGLIGLVIAYIVVKKKYWFW